MNILYEKQIKPKSKTALIMCTYKRFRNLPQTYKDLSNQTNKDFDFYICDNSGANPKLLKIINRYQSHITYNLFVKEYWNQYSIFGRFYLARDLANEGYEKIIFIDDDQNIPPDFIQDCYNQYDENIVKSFYAHMIIGDYWKKEMLDPYEEGNYVGGGGLLCNASIFLDDNLFSCPEEYWVLDDLSFSYYIANFTNYKMKKLNTHITFIKDSLATAKNLKKEKVDFTNKYIINKKLVKNDN